MKERSLSKIAIITDYFWQVLLISLLFVLFSIMGLIIFGIAPSLGAAHKTMSDYIKKENNKLFSSYFAYFKGSFISDNITFYLYGAVMAGISISFYLFLQMGDPLLQTTGLLIDIVLFIYVFMAFSFYHPLRHFFKASPFEVFKLSFYFPWQQIAHLFISMILLVALLAGLVLITYWIIGLFMGLYILIINLFANRMFTRLKI